MDENVLKVSNTLAYFTKVYFTTLKSFVLKLFVLKREKHVCGISKGLSFLVPRFFPLFIFIFLMDFEK
jgi:hypothetical protein